jgi:hypothetical protein
MSLFLQGSLSFVYVLIEHGKFLCLRLGRVVRVQADDLIRATDASKCNGHGLACGAQGYVGEKEQTNV